ncbi:hypothetical protein IT084_04300 [Desulfallas sp. Bu1-1]|uniref:hypothetical protein n=1 Tax=Desulfallas sp. Bu1-1 TaxID=2787620 RepID=UPI0018A0AE39|nr:hypothetical protein [Desulfallas sp. Bu1-1]MBF7082196.1 hypothetical protein [Desulfallas sp. Bu1-1]
MARLYDMPRETAGPELTTSLAQSLKKGLLLPTEQKFNLLEQDITALRQEIETGTAKLTVEVGDKFARLEARLAVLHKLLRAGASLSLVTLACVIAVLVILAGR